VQQNYGKNIDEHLVLMKMTNALFEGSKYFYYKQIAMYCLYLIPFFYQLIILDHLTDDVDGKYYDET